MLAHALLAVIAADEREHQPHPTRVIALTCNEIRRLFARLIIEPGRVLACPWPGHAGGANTSTTPEPATTPTVIKTGNRNDLRLEY